MSSNEIPVIKVFICGEGGVGKSTLIERLVTGIFNPNLIMTIGVNHAVKHMKTSDGRSVILQIWDIGGEERFRFIIPKYIKGSTAGIVTYDTTRLSSFVHLEEDGWLQIIRDTLPTQKLFLIGTKCDVPNQNPEPADLGRIVEKYNIQDYIITSSKTGENVDSVFQQLADCLPEGPSFYAKPKNENES